MAVAQSERQNELRVDCPNALGMLDVCNGAAGGGIDGGGGGDDRYMCKYEKQWDKTAEEFVMGVASSEWHGWIHVGTLSSDGAKG